MSPSARALFVGCVLAASWKPLQLHVYKSAAQYSTLSLTGVCRRLLFKPRLLQKCVGRHWRVTCDAMKQMSASPAFPSHLCSHWNLQIRFPWKQSRPSPSFLSSPATPWRAQLRSLHRHVKLGGASERGAAPGLYALSMVRRNALLRASATMASSNVMPGGRSAPTRGMR